MLGDMTRSKTVLSILSLKSVENLKNKNYFRQVALKLLAN